MLVVHLERWAEPVDLVVAKVSSDTQEVTGSNPVSPTTDFLPRKEFLGPADLRAISVLCQYSYARGGTRPY
jgi:hypothetical protein